jgi:hypothetical protein
MSTTTPGKNTLELDRDLASLGIAFAMDVNNTEADPELAFVRSLSEWGTERKTLKLLLAWIDRMGDLVHIERLKSLADTCNAVELAWLGGFASIQVNKKDLRWAAIEKFCQKKLGPKMPRFEISKLDTLQALKSGTDEHFARYGITIATVTPSDDKKLVPRESILRTHRWLRIRQIFGTNYRADMVYALMTNQVENAHQAEKLLGCTSETAYRLWKSLEMLKGQDVIRLQAS